jgi:Na+-driven multidrug efflux pump
MKAFRWQLQFKHITLVVILVLGFVLASCVPTDEAIAETKADMATFFRGFVIVCLFIGSIASVTSAFGGKDTERKQRIIGIVGVFACVPLLVYLLVVKGWWVDTVLLILDVIKDEIFG